MSEPNKIEKEEVNLQDKDVEKAEKKVKGEELSQADQDKVAGGGGGNVY